MQNEFGTSSVFNPVPFDSRDEQYKKPFGAVSTRGIITFNFPVALYNIGVVTFEI